MEKIIVDFAKRYDAVQNIMHQIDVKTLKWAYQKQPDTAIKELYGRDLDAHIQELLYRMKNFSFFPATNKLAKRESSEHEFGLFEAQIVECVFARILVLIYDEKCPVIFALRGGKIQVQNVGSWPRLYPYTWKAEFRILNRSVDQKKLTDFLGQYIDDRNFMKYLGRFLKSGVMEKPVKSDVKLTSNETLASILMHIYCYHILREWLCSKGDSLRGNVYLCYCNGYFNFGAYYKKDLLKICNGLVDDQDETGMQIAGNAYIEVLSGRCLNGRFTSKNQRKIGGNNYEIVH